MSASSSHQYQPFPKPGEMLKPATYGGQTKDKFNSEALFDATFPSRTPPVIPRNSIIVAVCGVPMEEVEEDSFFLSDFYLMHELCKDTAIDQFWLTAIEPTKLLSKFSDAKLLHGHPTSQRKVVLSPRLARESCQDVVALDPMDIGDRFLAYVEQASKRAGQSDRPLVVMTFCHGQTITYGLLVGGREDYIGTQVVKPIHLELAIRSGNRNPKVTLVTDSCYGGGWTIAQSGNMTVLAGVDIDHEILSWPVSNSIDHRYCGTRYITGLAESLCRAELETPDDFVLEDIREAPTFAALTKSIHDIVTLEIDSREKTETPSFAAQDDAWSTDYRKLSGIPLSRFRENYESLEVVPPGEADPNGVSATGSLIHIPSQGFVSQPRVLRDFQMLAKVYLASYPGPKFAAKNCGLWRACCDILHEETISRVDPKKYSRWTQMLDYRMRLMNRATAYKNRLGLTFLDCEEIDASEAYKKITHGHDTEACGFLRRIFGVIAGLHNQLFDEPEGQQVFEYVKPTYYLSVMFHGSGYCLSEIKKSLLTLIQQEKKSTAKFQTSRLRSSPEVKKNANLLIKSSSKESAIW